MKSFTITAAILIGASILWALLRFERRLFRARANPPRQLGEGVQLLYHGIPMQVFSACGLSFGVALGAVPIFAPLTNIREVVVTGVIAVVISVAGAWSLINALAERCEFSEWGVVQHQYFVRSRSAQWSAIVRMSYSQTLGWVRLETGEGEVLRISVLFNGFDAFAEELRQRIPEVVRSWEALQLEKHR